MKSHFSKKPEIKTNETTNHNLILVGRKAVGDAISDSFLRSKIYRIYLTSSQQHLIKLCQDEKIGVEIVTKNWFEKKFRNENHQNCCLIIRGRASLSLEQLITRTQNQKRSLILLLDQIQDPHNFGAILRTAAAANVDGVIVANRNQVKLTTTVLKVSAGAGLLIDVVEVSNLNAALDKLKKAGYWSYASLLGDGTQNYDQVDYADKSVLIVGNEGNGISKLLAQNTDFKIQIPMIKQVESLNVAVATGILIYQMVK
ncbi:23S rRNA (guanosine2251-2'-O)-methyltransferase [Mycoplasmoides fastidiosum]|uniref:23S rRNA (Guanosine2251-2'-O)-methyltransferase n=1 Tax=Mycoplasmoides fastidiosum TaxID=92758 RepID=A0ABU0LYE1_9BACT|nr:23S rRNA (guanosine(2251)-2'-O)-methyltransferase RlmB [Mycoplasmoides fastidiosum]MDQ0513704.1 23S rRNA (guanosine2251-2'-O)-methyltransferase [Mycoplasmoides fastidiosum]UUD37873.1 23S rRNA (guanosine(2251)-2'-O)-methyltransferase RlmB [Mycoplasmoides fastidiosum]